MDRRLFIAGMSSVLLPWQVEAGFATTPPGVELALDCFFVDRRFAATSLEAGVLPRGLEPIPVHLDAARVWSGALSNGRAPLALRGVTTEAFFFDLRSRLAGRVRDSQISRVGPDLHLWTMRCVNP